MYKKEINGIKNRIQICFVLAMLVLICFSCKKEEEIDNSPLGQIFSLAAENSNLRSLIVYKDGQIVKEKYFHSAGPNIQHDVRSVTKSVLATLVGIAIDKGFIKSDTVKIGTFLKPLASNIEQAKANIKISDLLSMTSGISGNDLVSVNEYEDWRSSPNQLISTLNKPMVYKPGEYFSYNSGASHILSIILTQATGMSTFEFARKYLFQPLVIADHSWEQDKQGNYNGSSGSSFTPHDMLKLGQLYLNKGTYNGVRVVSETWIDKVTSAKISTKAQPYASSYGYLWWIGSANGHNYSFANGYGGQFIVVVPDLKLVVVATNKWMGVPGQTTSQQWYSTLSIIMTKIIPLN
jgi:CubicO group peptidase (beta-lactamase class C family)